MRPSFKDYFHFTRIERNGIIGILILIFLLIGVNVFIEDFSPKSKPEKEKLKQLLAELDRKKEQLNQEERSKRSMENKANNKPDSIALFAFNPNNLPLNDWLALGLSADQVQVIKNYEAKGGVFRQKSDVQKMYTVSDELYQRLKPYILLPEKSPNDGESKGVQNQQTDKKKWKPIVMDINVSDSADLTKVYGIGPYYAGKIVEYRTKLGGYYSKRQLLEIWNFSDSMLLSLDSTLIMTKLNLKTFNVNLATAKELQQHPYINWNIANSIVNIRKQHGQYEKLDEIKKSVLINDSLFMQLSPYLRVND